MDDPLRVIAEAEGVFLRREVLQCGYDDKLIRRMVRAGLWHRVRQGAYCFGDVWAVSTREQRHLILARAVLRTTPGPVALSQVTALLMHGISVWGADLSRVHVTRLDQGAGRCERDVTHHVGMVLDGDLVEIKGMLVTVPARAVIETAMLTSLESALVSADSALFRRRCSPAELHRMFDRLNHWPDSQRVHVMLHHMDGRAESPGETRSRFMFWRYGVPVPDLQFEVYDDWGRLVAITDFVWRDLRRFGEFDGVVKYGREYQREEEAPAGVVVREKQREDLVRGITGYGCSRLMWPELARPVETSARFRRELGL